jgi:hypothetical protein
MSALFARLGAPLQDLRRSWGGVCADGTVILRVWQDETGRVDGKRCVQITNHEFFQGKGPSFGYEERNRHIEHIRGGAKCFMVMCEQKIPACTPREIHQFNGNELFVGGALLDHDGETWIEWVNRVPVQTLTPGTEPAIITRTT